jgi:hypothetical protein
MGKGEYRRPEIKGESVLFENIQLSPDSVVFLKYAYGIPFNSKGYGG